MEGKMIISEALIMGVWCFIFYKSTGFKILKMTKKEFKKKIGKYEQQIADKFTEVIAVNKLSPERVADYMGISTKQCYKYRKNINKIPAGSLYSLAMEVKIPITDFFPETHKNKSIKIQSLLKDRNICRMLKKLAIIEHRLGNNETMIHVNRMLDFILSITHNPAFSNARSSIPNNKKEEKICRK